MYNIYLQWLSLWVNKMIFSSLRKNVVDTEDDDFWGGLKCWHCISCSYLIFITRSINNTSIYIIYTYTNVSTSVPKRNRAGLSQNVTYVRSYI